MKAGTKKMPYDGRWIVVCVAHPNTILSRGPKEDIIVSCIECERMTVDWQLGCEAWGLVGRLAARDLVLAQLITTAGTADERAAINAILGEE